MTPDQVEQRVEEIRAIRQDDEGAHVDEDRLHRDVLKAIADGTADDPMECARLALTTREIEFSRWCA